MDQKSKGKSLRAKMRKLHAKNIHNTSVWSWRSREGIAALTPAVTKKHLLPQVNGRAHPNTVKRMDRAAFAEAQLKLF
jgi:hypothetical protein